MDTKQMTSCIKQNKYITETKAHTDRRTVIPRWSKTHIVSMIKYNMFFH